MHSERDRAIWDAIFAAVPPDWRVAPPSSALVECTEFLRRSGVRSVLDLGCGIGRWSVHLARAGLHVCATDFAPNAIAYATEWAESERLAIRFVCRPITEVAFPGERFDAVVAALVLDNITRAEMHSAIMYMRSALRPGGVAFCLFNPLTIDDDDSAGNPTAGITRVVYTDAELNAAFQDFRVLDMRTYEAGTRGIYLQRASTLNTEEDL